MCWIAPIKIHPYEQSKAICGSGDGIPDRGPGRAVTPDARKFKLVGTGVQAAASTAANMRRRRSARLLLVYAQQHRQERRGNAPPAASCNIQKLEA